MEYEPQIGERITDKSATPDNGIVQSWIGPEAFAYWRDLRTWIEASYPGLFTPEWLYGGRNKGWSLRYKKTKAFCTLVPEYRRLSAVVVLGSVEREMFEDRRLRWRSGLVTLFEKTKTYPDGKFLAVPISSAEEMQELKELLAMKRSPISPPLKRRQIRRQTAVCADKAAIRRLKSVP